MLDLGDIFGSSGPLQRALPDFKVRRQQLRMAERIATALQDRETLAVEAGTGTGKTFAYLVPVLLSGLRVLISTGTRTLQDQLFGKDLPLLAGALGRPARVALLKGRANYLCRHRLDLLGESPGQLSLDGREGAGPMLARIRQWARTTRAGDLAEIRGLADSHPLWPQVTSTRENCLGTRCADFGRCHVVAARREALEADVVIVNHHLLLADLALKEDGFGDILGAADAVILDEAHQIPDLATQFFGANVSSRRIESLLRDVQIELSAAVHLPDEGRPRPYIDAVDALSSTESAFQRLVAGLPSPPSRLSWTDTRSSVNGAIAELSQELQALHRAVTALEPQGPLAALAERIADVAASLERIAAVDDIEGARTAETLARGFTLTLLPFDISARFQSLLRSHRCAWVFTSATLSLGEDFSHFTTRLGLQTTPTLKIESPFDYERQSLLYLPPGFPQPADPAYVAAVIDTAVPLINGSRGGAFILFTSHRALAQGAALLRQRWGGAAPFQLFVQGEAPREHLLHEFRENGNGVLLGTTSFWEGVDVKGEALRLVVIEKLPFASPDDPLVRARIDHLQATGGNPFRDYQLPEAAMALKQGVGRLIRSEDDYGAVVICDPRLLGRSYGRVLVAALPAMSVTRERDEVLRFLRRHSPAPAPTAERPLEQRSVPALGQSID